MATTAAISYDPKAQYEVEVLEVEYRQGYDDRIVRIYQPQGPGPFPALIDVHGGAWSAGDRFQNEGADRALAASGLVVAAIDFRVAPKHPYPAQVQDTNQATRWFKAHAGDFNATAEGLGGMGTSSGAHTLLLSVMKPNDPRYNNLPVTEAVGLDSTMSYVLLCWGVLDSWVRYEYAKPLRADGPRQGAGNGGHLASSTEGYFLTEEAMKEGNPQMVLDRGEKVELPPALIVQGFPDSNIPKPIPERFFESYQKAGGSIELEWFPGAPLGFLRDRSADNTRALEVIMAYIAGRIAVSR